MIYVILEKDLNTEMTRVHSAYENEAIALIEFDRLIDETEEFGYKIEEVNLQ